MKGRQRARCESGSCGCLNQGDRSHSLEAGFSYVEVLVATMLIALVLVPAIEGLSTGVLSAGMHRSMAEENFHLASRLEETLAQPFNSLDVEAVLVGDPNLPTAYSDAPGADARRLVFLARYDGDDADGDGDRFTGGDEGLLWVRVEFENTDRFLETLTTK